MAPASGSEIVRPGASVTAAPDGSVAEAGTPEIVGAVLVVWLVETVVVVSEAGGCVPSDTVTVKPVCVAAVPAGAWVGVNTSACSAACAAAADAPAPPAASVTV